MEIISLFGCCKVRGGIFVGVISLIDNLLKGAVSVLVLVRNGFLGDEYRKLFDKGERDHFKINSLSSINCNFSFS
jgi:hypothetical protein